MFPNLFDHGNIPLPQHNINISLQSSEETLGGGSPFN